MEDDIENFPPTKRRRARVLWFIEHRDDEGRSSFDPWPLAELYAELHRSPDESTHNRLLPGLRKLGEACDAAEKVWKDQGGTMLRGPRMLVFHAEKCLRLRPEIDDPKSDGSAVLEAISTCAAHGLVIPPWLAVDFVRRYERAIYGECKGWSDPKAFGAATPKQWNLAGVRARLQDAPWAYEVAVKMLMDKPKAPIDRAFYEAVGKQIGKGHAQTQTLVKDHLRRADDFEAPLVHIRGRLLNGDELGRIQIEWADGRWDRQRASEQAKRPKRAARPKKG